MSKMNTVYSDYINHLIGHNPLLAYNQDSCELCHLFSQGLVEFDGRKRPRDAWRKMAKWRQENPGKRLLPRL